jgi:hypothetical protein
MSSLSLKRWWVWLWCEATEHEFFYFYLAKQAKSHSSLWNAQNHTRHEKGHKKTSQDSSLGAFGILHLQILPFLAEHITVKFFQTSSGVYLDSGASFMKVKWPLYTVVHPGKLGAHQNPSYIRLGTSHTHLQLEEAYFSGLYSNSRNVNLTIGNPSSLI